MKESKTVEFKRSLTRSFLKTVSAFANFGTGEILFGINDEGSIVGVEDAASTCLAIENSINDNISPMPRYTLEMETRNKKEIVVLKVFLGSDKPYLYKGKAYRRNDTADVEVDRSELKRLILEGQNLSFEEIRSQRQDLEFTVLSHQLETRADVQHVNLDIFKTLRLYARNEGYNNAAAILADTNEFPGIDIVRFGSNISELLDRETVAGQSALMQLNQALVVYRRYYQLDRIEGATRNTHELVPEDAFREAVANALVHRLWDMPSHIQISMEPDRILITSPGGLPSGITLEEYANGRVSILRNPIIANVFYRLNHIEMFGTGTERIKQAYDHSLLQPEFSATDNSISVVLPVVENVANLTEAEMSALHLFEGGRVLSRREVEAELEVSQAKAGRLLNGLIGMGVLERQASGRSSKYRLRR